MIDDLVALPNASVMSCTVLTASQRSQLKSQAHALAPVVLVGAGGLTQAVEREIDRALTSHGLIKVRITGAERNARREIAETIESQTGAAVVQLVGHVVVLFREPPADREPRSRAVSLIGPAPGLQEQQDRQARLASAGAARSRNEGQVPPRKRMSRSRISALKKAVTPRSGTFLVADSKGSPAPRSAASKSTGAPAGSPSRKRGSGGSQRPVSRSATRPAGRPPRKSTGGPRR